MSVAAVCLALVCVLTVAAPSHAFPRPDHTEHAKLARWLVHTADWGTLSTINAAGFPVGGVVSFSDGAPDNPSGRLFFYLTPMDETAQNLKINPNCALTIGEAQLLPSGCRSTDPEDPTCAKISVLGSMQAVSDAQDVDAAAAALFSRHPAMQEWPQDHGFKFFELKISEIHMLDWYGGMHIIATEEYFAAGPSSSSSSSTTLQQAVRPARRGVGRITLQ